MLIAATTWADVAIALIAGFPGIVAAVAALIVRREVKTPSGETIGALAERTHDITHTTSMIVGRTLGGRATDRPQTPAEVQPHSRIDDPEGMTHS